MVHIYRPRSLAKQGDNALAGICLSLLPCFKVKVKGQGQGQRTRSRSWLKVKDQGQISGVQRSILGAHVLEIISIPDNFRESIWKIAQLC